MGKGDRRSKRGKIWRGSFGTTRLHKPEKGQVPESSEKPKKVKIAAPKKVTKAKAKK